MMDKDEDRLEFTAVTALTLAKTLDEVGQAYVADGGDERVHPSEVLDHIIYLASQHLLVDPNYRPDHFRQAARKGWRA